MGSHGGGDVDGLACGELAAMDQLRGSGDELSGRPEAGAVGSGIRRWWRVTHPRFNSARCVHG